MRKTIESVPVNNIKMVAETIKERAIPNSKIMQINQTDLFYNELPLMIEHKDVIDIHISGEVSSGKSTVMCQLITEINQKLGLKMGLDKICSDQLEWTNRDTFI